MNIESMARAFAIIEWTYVRTGLGWRALVWLDERMPPLSAG